MDKSFEIKGYINNVLKETGLEGADAFDKALLLNALGKFEAAEHSDESVSYTHLTLPTN